MAETADILARINKRPTRHVGIGIASDYVSTIGSCFGEAGADRFFGMGSDRQWADALKASQQKLVYRDDAMTVTVRSSGLAVAKRTMPGGKPAGGGKAGDAVKDGKVETVAGACMVFDCVLTSQKRDRDRDILEPAGARVDPSMPLLWQHIPMQPIGKMIRVVSQDEKQVVIRCAIADNAFGNDVAKLVEFGALRISHGFVPTKFEPIKEDEDLDPWMQGWHVIEYDVLEVSTVSIPSNTDATITGFSRGKLHHPLVKSWAETQFRARPTVVPAGEQTKMTLPINVHVHIGDEMAKTIKGKADDEETPKEGEEGTTEEKMEVSELASIGRVHLMIEQAMKIDGIPEEASALLTQALGELEATMNGENTEEEPEENDEETEEEKETEEDEDKDPDQYVMEDEETDEEKGEDDEDEDEEKGDVTPSDSEGRADDDEEDGKSYDVADDLFQSLLAKHRAAPAKKSAPHADKGKGGKAKAPAKGGKAKK